MEVQYNDIHIQFENRMPSSVNNLPPVVEGTTYVVSGSTRRILDSLGIVRPDIVSGEYVEE